MRETMRLCEAAKELDIPLEINLLEICDNRYYPNHKLMKAMGEVGCKVILGMDAHDSERTCDFESYNVAMSLVKEFELQLVEQLDITKL